MKIVVTGALGHIGSALIRQLPLHFPKAEIVMLDNMMTQRYPSLFDLPAAGRYQFIETDVRTIDLRPLIADAHAVVHLAAITDAAGTFDRAVELEANNFDATAKIAAACRDVGTRLVHLSSTSVYGTQNDVVSEDCAPDELKPQSPYATTKLKEEALVQSLAKAHGMRAIVFRFGTIFGASPGMRYHTAVNKFCWQAVMKQPLSIWRSAYDQKRPYLDLVDAIRAIAFVVKQDLFDGQGLQRAHTQCDRARHRRMYPRIRAARATVVRKQPDHESAVVRSFVPAVSRSRLHLRRRYSPRHRRNRRAARGRQSRLGAAHVHFFGDRRRRIYRRQLRVVLAARPTERPYRHYSMR